MKLIDVENTLGGEGGRINGHLSPFCWGTIKCQTSIALSRPVLLSSLHVIPGKRNTACTQHTLCPCVISKLVKCLPVILGLCDVLPLVPLLAGILQCAAFPNAEEISLLLTKKNTLSV